MTSKKQTTKTKEVYYRVDYPEAKKFDTMDEVFLAFDGFDAVLFVPQRIYEDIIKKPYPKLGLFLTGIC